MTLNQLKFKSDQFNKKGTVNLNQESDPRTGLAEIILRRQHINQEHTLLTGEAGILDEMF